MELAAEPGFVFEMSFLIDPHTCTVETMWLMKVVVFRPNELHGSWRPCSLVDRRGPRFPDAYGQILVLEAENVDLRAQCKRMQAQNIAGLFDKYVSQLGDIVFLGEGEELIAYVAGPFSWEIVKFGREWKSPE